MNNSVLSFTISTFFWLLIVGIISLSAVKNHSTLNTEAEISIDAEMIGEFLESKKQDYSKKRSDSLNKKSSLKTNSQKSILDEKSEGQGSKKNKSQSPKVLYRPLPQIPSDLRKEAFQTQAIVRFFVAKDGSVDRFEFVRSSSNPRLNFLLIKKLKEWKFEAANESFEKDVVVNFIVR